MLRSRPLVAVSLTPHIKNVEAFLAHCHRRRYPAKSTIIYAGDKSDSLYYIVRGSVTVLIEDDEGKEMIVAYLNDGEDRKSTRLNSSHVAISYAVFCLK